MRRYWTWLCALLACGALIRLLLLTDYAPLSAPDTQTYFSAARDLLSGDFTISQGRRTPGYPLFVAAMGESPSAIVIAQMAGGLLVSLLLFGLAVAMTGSAVLAFAVGLSYHLNLQQIFVEAALITEALSTLGVVAVVSILLPAMRRARAQHKQPLVALGLGLLVGSVVLLRPQFIFLPLLVPALLLLAAMLGRPQTWRPKATALGHAGLVAGAAATLLVGWSLVVWTKVGHFTMSTQAGFGLVNHSVRFVEYAPDRYATLREILLKHRQERIAASGHSGNTIWYAWPEIRERTGLSLPDASRELQRMSVELILAHPGRYAVSVAEAWVSFWTVPIIWNAENLRPVWRSTLLPAVWAVEHKLLRLANLAFVLLVAAAAASSSVRRRLAWDMELSAVSAVILASSLVQALADQGAGSRYLITTQSLVLLVLFVAAQRARRTPGRSLGP